MKNLINTYKSDIVRFKNWIKRISKDNWILAKDIFGIATLPFTFLYRVIIDSFIGDISSVSEVYVNNVEVNSSDLNMIEVDYSTHSDDHRLWLDNLYDRIGYSNFTCSLILCLIPLVLGYIYSLLIGFHSSYIRTLPIWLGVIGVFLTCFTIRFGSKSFHKKYSYLRPCFMVSDENYKHFISTWLDRLSNNSPTIVFSIIAFIVFISLAYIRYYHSEILEYVNLISIEPKGFLVTNWYEEPHMVLKFLLMSFFAFFVAFPLITALRVLYINFFFLLDFRKLPVIPFSNILKIRLRKITNMYIIISSLWMIGVALFGVLFFTKYDTVSLVLILSLSFLGFATFIAPQIIYRTLLIRSEEVNSSLVMHSFYENLGGGLRDINSKIYNRVLAEFRITEYVDIIDSTQIADKWIYNPAQIATFLIGQALALLSPRVLKTISEIQEQITMYNTG